MHPARTRAAAILLGAGLLLPGLARGQNALGLETRRFEALRRRVASQDSVRAHTEQGAIVVPYPTLTADSLVSTGPGIDPRLDLRGVSAIDGRGNLVRDGALVGAAVSVGLELIVLLACDHCDHGFANVLGFTVGSAGAGALTGALVGLPLTRWRTLYRAP